MHTHLSCFPIAGLTLEEEERLNPFEKLQKVLKDVKYDKRVRPNAFGMYVAGIYFLMLLKFF